MATTNGKDQIVIEITAETEKAKQSIKELQEKLKEIGDSFNTSELTSAFEKVNQTLKGLKGAKVIDDKQSGEIKKVAKELENIKKTQVNLDNVSKSNILPSGFVDDLKKANITLKELDQNANGSVESIKLMGANLKPNSEQFNEIKEHLKSIGLEISDISTNAQGLTTISAKQTKETKKQEKSLSNQKGFWEKIGQSTKRIMFYRFVRTLYHQLVNLVKQSFSALYSLSEKLGTSFAPAVDNLKSSFVYLGNAIFSIIAPIIEQLAPVLSIVADSVAKLMNVIAKLMASFMGAKYITQAKKSLEKFNSEAKKTSTLGIDELNVLGDTNNQQDWFEITEIEQGKSALMDILKLIAEAIEKVNDSGIEKIIKVVLDIINELLSVIKQAGFGEFLNFWVGSMKRISDLISGFLNGLKPLLSSIFKLLEPIFIIVEAILNLILDIVEPIIKIITIALKPLANIIERIRPIITALAQVISMVLKVVGSALGTALDNLGDILDAFSPIIDALSTILEIFKPITKAIEIVFALFTGNTEKAKNIFNDMCKSIQTSFYQVGKNIGNFFIDILNGLATGIEALVNGIIKAINGLTQGLSNIWTWLGIPAIPKIAEQHWGRIPRLATGGQVVEDGLFLANHNELIGSFGGRTTVANNEQITNSIYLAVRDALSESNFNKGNETIIVKVGAKEVAREVRKVEKEKGVSIYSGGVNGYGI